MTSSPKSIVADIDHAESRPATLLVMGACREALGATVFALLMWLIGPLATISAQDLAPPKATSEIAAKAIPATATILTIGADGDTLAQGSGFILRADGVIVTNYHVLKDASSAVVILASGKRVAGVTVLAADSALDLAILKIASVSLPKLTPRTTTPRIGEKVVAIGSPLGLSQSVTEGIVSATRVVKGRELIQISAPISHGSSGGAVLDDRGRVFAVSALTLTEGQSLNFAIPVRYALEMLAAHRQERTIAQVFATTGAPATSGAPKAPSLYVRRASVPRADISGTYTISNAIVNGAGQTDYEETGLLFANSGQGGLMRTSVTSRLSPTDSTTVVKRVVRLGTNGAGDVTLDVEGRAYVGYQLENGKFVVTRAEPRLGEKYVEMLVATPTRLPLSKNEGLYDVRAQAMTWVDGRLVGVPREWTGDLAVGFAPDGMYVSIAIGSATESWQLVGRSPLVDDTFEISDWFSQARLRGTLRNGVLEADWTNTVSTSLTVRGHLTAVRK